jgi:arginyl-tRNA synthetase
VTEAAEQAAREAAKGRSDEFSETEKADLYQMLGLGALKYYLLKVEPTKRMLFDPNESVDLQGHTGPYIQYVHARIRSILRQADADLSVATNAAMPDLAEVERQLIFQLGQYPQRVAEAGADYAPSYVAQYVYELARTFNQFYDQLQVLKEADGQKRQFRLQLAGLVAETIRRAMGLLGVDVPEKM